jgi:hypothetical protein
MNNARPCSLAFAATLAVAGLCVPAAAGTRDFHVAIDSVFMDFVPVYGSLPVTVDIENKGPNARGVLHVSADGFEMDYPIELPRGSKKRVYTYPQVDNSYGAPAAIDYTLITDQGTVNYRVNAQMFGQPTPNAVALISNNAGDLGFLKQRDPVKRGKPQRQGETLNDVYVKPENAPPRTVGYQGLTAVVLGEGAERMSDDAVRSIRLWGLSGGTIIFIGGASTAVLQDPRWRTALPIEGVDLQTLKGSAVLSKLGGQPVNETLTLAMGKPAPGARIQADGGAAVVVQRPYGLGRVAYIACNPFEAPLNRWPGRKQLFGSLVMTSQAKNARAYLDQFQADRSQYEYGGMYTSSTTGGWSSPPDARSDDPFSTTLPPTSRVFTIMVAYFIVVVPINFIILRRLKKGEWAWVTSPLISLAFAGAFLSSAGDLYAAKLSRATRGLVVAREGDDTGLFVGKSELFFPQGGEFDLGLKNADSVGVAANMNEYSYGRPTRSGAGAEDLNPTDDGSVKLNRMSVNNLTFRQVSFRQIVPTQRWFSFSLKPSGRGMITCSIRNNTGRTLSRANLVSGGQTIPIPDIPPGQTASIDIRSGWAAQEGEFERMYGGNLSVSMVAAQNGGIAVVGDLKDLEVGPQIGRDVPSRTSIRMAYFAAQGVLKGSQ